MFYSIHFLSNWPVVFPVLFQVRPVPESKLLGIVVTDLYTDHTPLLSPNQLQSTERIL